MSTKTILARELVQNTLEILSRVLFNKLDNVPRKNIENKSISELIEHMVVLRWHLTARKNIPERRREIALRVCQITIADLYEI